MATVKPKPKKSAKKPVSKSKAAQAISPVVGRWATIWWGLSCVYVLLAVYLHYWPFRGQIDAIILTVKAIGLALGWVWLYRRWRQDLKKAKVSLADGLRDLLTIRR